ncbi:hypothetical protein [Salibacterium aidingense]|uniref:hypothetical protein n=1 Tax=Salibacterium aidingense TaxID=384933 RepID=UPI00041A3A74|nr:hypothetical protein [Salibacterium aidingense]
MIKFCKDVGKAMGSVIVIGTYSLLFYGYLGYWIAENIFSRIPEKEVSLKDAGGVVCLGIVLAVFVYPRLAIKKEKKSKKDPHKILEKKTKELHSSYVIGTQVYRYEYVPTQGEIFIRHVNGAYAARENIKTIEQHVYELDAATFTNLLEIYNGVVKYKELLELYRENVEKVKICIQDGKLGKATNYYSLVLFLAEFINKRMSDQSGEDTFVHFHFRPDIDVPSAVVENENNGLFRAVLNAEILQRDQYVFWNKTSSSKNGRIYISFKVPNKPYMVLVTLSEAIKHMEVSQRKKHISKIMTAFNNLVDEKGEDLIQ